MVELLHDWLVPSNRIRYAPPGHTALPLSTPSTTASTTSPTGWPSILPAQTSALPCLSVRVEARADDHVVEEVEDQAVAPRGQDAAGRLARRGAGDPAEPDAHRP